MTGSANLLTSTEPESAEAIWAARIIFPVSDRAPVTARRLVSTILLAWGCGEQVEIGELVASELVANAVQYAGNDGDIELSLVARAGTIQLSVADGSPDYPVLLASPHNEFRGLGLHMVDRVATRWGVHDYLTGKRVWVELPCESPE
jgi:anti-sigma regulatory factor (Ser/Thr protein kinase)